MSLGHQFKLSNITVNLNNRNGLQKTIESVINQTHQDFERIIIDGGSIDGSKECHSLGNGVNIIKSVTYKF